MQASSIFLNGRRIAGVDAGGLWPPLILEIMMMATRRNDEDDNAIRRHFGFKLEGTFVVFARGGRLHLIDRGDGASDDERTVYDGDAPTDDVSASGGGEA